VTRPDTPYRPALHLHGTSLFEAARRGAWRGLNIIFIIFFDEPQ